jgi:hypothetical protein
MAIEYKNVCCMRKLQNVFSTQDPEHEPPRGDGKRECRRAYRQRPDRQ